MKVAEGKWIDYARYCIEVVIDRPLRRTEQVRFKDNNKENCDLDNLEVWEMQRTWPM
jgi:hypothetical protein